VDRRLTEIEARLAAMDERPMTFDPAEIARAGAFVSIDGEGRLHVERGYVRPEDELPVEPEIEPDSNVGPVPDATDATDATAAMPPAGVPLAAPCQPSPLRGESGDGVDDEQIQGRPCQRNRRKRTASSRCLTG
jgi:hypothetical protein